MQFLKWLYQAMPRGIFKATTAGLATLISAVPVANGIPLCWQQPQPLQQSRPFVHAAVSDYAGTLIVVTCRVIKSRQIEDWHPKMEISHLPLCDFVQVTFRTFDVEKTWIAHNVKWIGYIPQRLMRILSRVFLGGRINDCSKPIDNILKYAITPKAWIKPELLV